MEAAKFTSKKISCDVVNENLTNIDSEELHPTRLLSNLQNVCRDHLMKIEIADEERGETYRVNV